MGERDFGLVAGVSGEKLEGVIGFVGDGDGGPDGGVRAVVAAGAELEEVEDVALRVAPDAQARLVLPAGVLPAVERRLNKPMGELC